VAKRLCNPEIHSSGKEKAEMNEEQKQRTNNKNLKIT
jgi:hypothetical protein